MEILTTYNNDTLQLISDSESYLLPPDFNPNIHIIKLSVFSDVGSFLENEDLSKDIDYYIKDTQLFLKPNEYLDRTGFSENNYNLQFDFIQRFRENDVFYISEVSPSRKEIRIEVDEKVYENSLDDDLKRHITYFLHECLDVYNFNSFFNIHNQ